MDLKTPIGECTTYDFKMMLEENKPKSWLKSVSAFANGLGGSLFFGIDNNGIRCAVRLRIYQCHKPRLYGETQQRTYAHL